jgi:SAM-dependent methyltransferase
MAPRPFDFSRRATRRVVVPDWFSRRATRRFVVPDWFKAYWHPAESLRHWQWQADLARRGQPHTLPDDCMRMPANELHQLMAKEFWAEVPRDFDSILDVGCSDGYMVKVFRDAGKNAAGINDFLYPTDRLWIQEHALAVSEMDMHAMTFADRSFDAVWCRHTLEHSFAPLQVLAEIYRVLKPEGYLFAALPPPPEPPEPYEGHWHQIPDYQFRYLLEMSHFTVLSMRTAWFSHKRENDNLEIRAIGRKRPAPGAR